MEGKKFNCPLRLLFPALYDIMYFCTRAISLFVHFREATSLIRIANVARGTTTSALHPCRLLPSSILASPSRTPPFPSASSRRARSSRLFPLRAPLVRFARFVQRHGYFCCSSRFSFFSCCPLPPPTDSPLLSLSLRLRFSSSQDSFLFSSLSLVPPRFNLFQLLLLFSPSERDAENDEEQVRGKDRGREKITSERRRRCIATRRSLERERREAHLSEACPDTRDTRIEFDHRIRIHEIAIFLGSLSSRGLFPPSLSLLRPCY